MVISRETLLPTGRPAHAAASDGVLFHSRWSLLVPVLVPRLLAQMALAMNIVVLPLEVLSMGQGYSTVGYVMAAVGAGAVCGNYPSGSLCARHGTRLVAMGSFAGLALGAAMCSLAEGPPSLAVGAFVIGFCEAAEVVSRQSYVTAAVDPQNLGRALSIVAATKRLGYTLGPLLAGFIGRRRGFPMAYMAMCGVSLVGLLWTIALMPPVASKSKSKGPDRGHGQAEQGGETSRDAGEANPSDFSIAGIIRKHWRRLLVVQVFVMALSFLRVARNLLLPMVGHTAQLGVGNIGKLMSLSYAVDSLLFPLAGWLLDTCGRATTAALCSATYAVAMSCLVGETAFWVAVFSCVSGLANGLSNGLIMTIGSEMAPQEAREPFIGVYETLATSAELVAPLAVGSLAEELSLASAVFTSIAVALVGSTWSFCCMQTLVPQD